LEDEEDDDDETASSSANSISWSSDAGPAVLVEDRSDEFERLRLATLVPTYPNGDGTCFTGALDSPFERDEEDDEGGDDDEEDPGLRISVFGGEEEGDEDPDDEEEGGDEDDDWACFFPLPVETGRG
jgi:hypothetical protein